PDGATVATSALEHVRDHFLRTERLPRRRLPRSPSRAPPSTRRWRPRTARAPSPRAPELPQFRDSVERHRNSCDDDDESAQGREQTNRPALEADAAKRALCEDGDEADGGNRRRKACAERQDQDEAERDPMERDRGE